MATVEAITTSTDGVPDAIIAASATNTEAPVALAAPRFLEVSVKDIITKAGDNIRTGDLPDIEELAKSIETEGLVEPIVITISETAGKYTVVAGHRRLTAIKSLGHLTVPAMVVDADVNRRIKLALIENIQRKDMSAVDKAKAFSKLIKNTGLEQQQVAEAIGVAPGYVSQYIALLALPESALMALKEEDLSFTQARALCRLLPDTEAIDALVAEAPYLTVAAMEAKVAHLHGLAKTAGDDEDIEDGEEGEEGAKKPRKKKAAKPAPTDKALEYYTEAEFHPLKKEGIRELMINYKRKEVNAESAKKREEYRLILKGITLAADLRLK